MPLSDVIRFILLTGVMTGIILRGVDALEYNWQWYRVPQFIFRIEDGHLQAGPLIDGLWLTLRISGLGLICSFVIGLATAFFRLSNSVLAQAVARLYVEIIRNTPLLVQIFFIYFVLAPVFGMERFTAAVLALSLFEGAYASEIFRSGLDSIQKGQWEAAYSIGLNTYLTYRLVIFPLAIRRILPPLTGQGVSLIKDSALVSTIAVYDLTMEAQAIISETFLTFELWFTIAGFYLALTFSLSLFAGFLERRLTLKT